jgi:galactose mutarotase-like enzyme
MGTIRLGGDPLWVECDPDAGFVISAIVDAASGANALWQRTGFVPGEPRRVLGPAGDPSIESFIDLFVGGWFEMFPTTGYPGTVPGAVGPALSLLHGEAMRLPWVVTHQDASSVVAAVTTVRTPFRLTRRLEIEGDELVVTEQAENLSPVSAPYVWGHHPCFDRATFAGGRFEIDVASAEVPAPVFDERNNSLVAGASFLFPDAPMADGGVRDVAAVPVAADGRHEQTTFVVRRGGVRITSPRIGRAFSLMWDERDFPHVLLWQDYRAEGAAFWGTCDTFAVEPSSAPGRSLDDAVAAGAVRELEPGGSVSITMRARWGAIDEPPGRGGSRL